MKKVILSAIALFAFTTVFAQTEQGKIMIGATSSLGFTTQKFEDADDALNIFDISPQVGYFVIDNLAIGAKIELESTTAGDFKTSTFNAGPLARYYFLEGNIKPFVQAEYLFGSTKIDSGIEGDDEDKTTTGEFGIAAGASFFLNDFIALDAQLRYGAGNSEADFDGAEKENYSKFGLNVGFNLFF